VAKGVFDGDGHACHDGIKKEGPLSPDGASGGNQFQQYDSEWVG